MNLGLFQLADFLVESVLAAGAAMFSQRQFFRCFGFVSLRDIVEVTADGAF